MGWPQYMNSYHKWSWGISKLNVPKTDSPINFGVLGAADFTNIGLIDPARTHPDVAITAVGARDLGRAQAQAKQYGIARAFGSYQEVIDLDDIDAIYIPLPIAFHAEWAIKAAQAGKHVLVEKPMCSNEEEAKKIRQVAEETGKVILEGQHWQFHVSIAQGSRSNGSREPQSVLLVIQVIPVNHIAKALVDSGRHGQVLSIHADLWAADKFAKDDIRNVYSLGGGAAMDLGYIFSAVKFFLGPDGEFEVNSSNPRLHLNDSLVDERVDAQMTFRPTNGSRNPVQCTAVADLRPPLILGIIPKPVYPKVVVELENATITVANYVAPHLQHELTVVNKATKITTKATHFDSGPKFGPRSEMYWSTYRYQLEAFVAKIRGEEPPHWIDLDESVATMKLIDQVYDKAGLPKRGLSIQR